MNKKFIRSPFFYVGDKYKLMPQLIEYFPKEINTFYDPFVGGGSSFINVKAKKYKVNDKNSHVILLHKYFYEHSSSGELYNFLIKTASEYNLSISCEGKTVPNDLKQKFKKTYYAVYNKEAYYKLRNDYNESKKIEQLYLLLIYGFNHMIRFNNSGHFNLPVGNVDFNKNTKLAINNYLDFVKNKDISYCNDDYIDFLNNCKFEENDFVYLDPPYLISSSEYNKIWNEESEKKLYDVLDELNRKNIKFGLSNIIVHKGRNNDIIKVWMKKYKVYYIESNYISYHNNKKKDTIEVYITNI